MEEKESILLRNLINFILIINRMEKYIKDPYNYWNSKKIKEAQIWRLFFK